MIHDKIGTNNLKTLCDNNQLLSMVRLRDGSCSPHTRPGTLFYKEYTCNKWSIDMFCFKIIRIRIIIIKYLDLKS